MVITLNISVRNRVTAAGEPVSPDLVLGSPAREYEPTEGQSVPDKPASAGSQATTGAQKPSASPAKVNTPPQPQVEIPLLVGQLDYNGNGIVNALDIVAGARKEVRRGTIYDAAYVYENNGYPPEGRGACTDLAWRAFRQAGFNLKTMLDQDIQEAPWAYGETGRNPDPNIDFRRVTNLAVFFQRQGATLTNEVIPGNVENLSQWQPGDVVIFAEPRGHIGIISDRRRPDGVPYVIHLTVPHAMETDILLTWYSPILYHFRYPAPTQSSQ
jgi:uncharacterized protein YijF (DUF1287 family)